MSTDYYRSKESVEGYLKAAADVDSKALIEQLKAFLPAGSSLLELGSGPGTDWRILNETYKVAGSDYSEEFLNHLKAENPDGEFHQLDAITLETELRFDGIYSNKVLHHLTDDELAQSIAAQRKLLNPNGIICHSFWKGEGTEMFNGMYVNYHTPNEIKTFFSAHFDILFLEEYAEFEERDSILLIGRTI